MIMTNRSGVTFSSVKMSGPGGGFGSLCDNA